MWNDLLAAYNGAPKLAAALGVSRSTLDRVLHGKMQLNPKYHARLKEVCDKHDINVQLEPARNPNLIPLRQLGDEIAAGLPTAPRTVQRLRAAYPSTQLIELAESNHTPETILRAITALLEDP